MNDGNTAARTPITRRYRAVVLSLIVVVSVVGPALVATPVAAADDASVDLGSNDPGELTTHNWTITAESASGENLSTVTLDYSGTGANLSAVGVSDVAVSIDSGPPVDIWDVDAASDELLDIYLDDPTAVNENDVVTVTFLDDVVQNPTIEDDHPASIQLFDDSYEPETIASGADTFTIGSGGNGGATGVIEGQVLNSSSLEGIEGATVSVFDDQGYPENSTVTDADGNYSVEVAEGTYGLSVTHDDYQDGFVSNVVVGENETVVEDVELEPLEFRIVDTSVEHVDGPEPAEMPDVDVSESGMAQIDLVDWNETKNQELSGLNVSSDTVFRVNATLEGYEPRVLIGTAKDLDWTIVDEGEDTVTVSITGKPASAEYIMGDPPTLDDWPEGDDDQADVSFEQMWSVAFDDMEYPEVGETEREQVQNTTLLTDAQVFSAPTYTEGPEGEAGELSISIGGPHLTVSNETNEGFFQGFLPDSQLAAWNVTDPEAELTANYKNETRDDLWIDDSPEDGVAFGFDVSYSTGDVTMTASDPANFDVDIEGTNEPVEGDELVVTANVTNAGDESATQTITLNDTAWDDELQDSVEVTLDGGEFNDSVELV